MFGNITSDVFTILAAGEKRKQEAIDPISTLTVARLREILRSRGLKVSGNKKEL